MTKPSELKQIDMVCTVKETFESYKSLSEHWRDRNVKIYDTYSTFTMPKKADWQTTFKINKAHEVVNKILPKIMARNPKWIVSLRTDDFEEQGTELDLAKKQEMARGIQDYLTYLFDKYNLREPLRLRAKNMLIYGNSFAKIRFRYETLFGSEDSYEDEIDEIGEPMMDENGEPMKKKVKKQNEKVVGEYPTIEPKSWTDIFVDPRYVLLDDMPAVIEMTYGVRFNDLKRKEKQYFNLDLVEALPEKSEFSWDNAGYKQKLYELSWIKQDNRITPIDKNKLTLKTYYWFYKFDTEEEKMCRITTVDDLFVVEYKEITYIPLEDIKCFEDTEVFYSVGFVEPIMWLQDEMNFKKNSASEYINQALNRSFVWSPNSWVNPRDLVSKPGNIIVTNKSADEAMKNIQELPFRWLPMDYFQEQNDIERQIQGQTFTVDTSNSRSDQALTNTATWIRVKFFESNSVIDQIRKQFEEGMERLAYKLLEETYNNMEDNIVFKKTGEEWRWQANKEMFRDAIRRYAIKVEVNSSSFESLESRREEALAMWQIGQQAMALWVPVDMKELWLNTVDTFEIKSPERFLQVQIPGMPWMWMPGQAPWWPAPWWLPPAMPEPWVWGIAEQTAAVAWGKDMLTMQ